MFLQLNLVKLFINRHYWEIVQFQAEEKFSYFSYFCYKVCRKDLVPFSLDEFFENMVF